MAIIYTIGFTKKSAHSFFSLLKTEEIKILLDVRLNPTSQLAGFAKKDDLAYFLEVICNCEYRHLPMLAPTKELLAGYHAKTVTWADYEIQFKKILEERRVEKMVDINNLDHACLLCAELTAERCHRRLVAEYLQKNIPYIKIKHL